MNIRKQCSVAVMFHGSWIDLTSLLFSRFAQAFWMSSHHSELQHGLNLRFQDPAILYRKHAQHILNARMHAASKILYNILLFYDWILWYTMNTLSLHCQKGLAAFLFHPFSISLAPSSSSFATKASNYNPVIGLPTPIPDISKGANHWLRGTTNCRSFDTLLGRAFSVLMMLKNSTHQILLQKCELSELLIGQRLEKELNFEVKENSTPTVQLNSCGLTGNRTQKSGWMRYWDFFERHGSCFTGGIWHRTGRVKLASISSKPTLHPEKSLPVGHSYKRTLPAKVRTTF